MRHRHSGKTLVDRADDALPAEFGAAEHHGFQGELLGPLFIQPGDHKVHRAAAELGHIPDGTLGSNDIGAIGSRDDGHIQSDSVAG